MQGRRGMLCALEEQRALALQGGFSGVLTWAARCVPARRPASGARRSGGASWLAYAR